MKHKAVIFDCDGVLIESEPIYSAVFAELCTEHGWPLTMEQAMAIFQGLPTRRCIEIVAEKTGHSELPDFEAEYQKRSIAIFEQELQPVPGVEDIICSLDCPIAVASSSSHLELRRSLEIVGFLDYFNGHIYSAQDVKHGKPNPDLFLYTAEKLGVDPADCAVIEDSDPGVEAGLRAGMVVYHFLPYTEPDETIHNGVVLTSSMFSLNRMLV